MRYIRISNLLRYFEYINIYAESCKFLKIPIFLCRQKNTFIKRRTIHIIHECKHRTERAFATHLSMEPACESICKLMINTRTL